MAKVTKDKIGHYVFNGEKYTIENITKNNVVFMSQDKKTVLLTNEDHLIISEIEVRMVDHYEPYLDVENYTL